MNVKALLAMLCLLNAVAFAADELKLKASVPFPGVKGRFDHFAVDTNAHRVFVAALGNNTLEVIDVTAPKRLHTITGLHKPTGVAFLPEGNQIVVANGDDGTVKIFNGANYQLVKNIHGFDDADNVRFDPKANCIYVGYGDGALAAIDAQRWEQVGTIKLKAHPESFQLEQNGRRIFVNVPEATHIAVVDRDKRTVIATWPMEKFHANFPMALDETNHRLFVGCRQPARVVVIDTGTGKPRGDFAISGDTDDLFWDAARKRIYASCGEGFLDAIAVREGNRYERVTHVATQAGARTCFFSTDLSQIYLAVPRRENQDAGIGIYQPE